MDIGQDRGLYIVADEGELQMRILGSVRFSAFYDSKNLLSKNSFSTFDIPTGDANINIGNYYNSLGFSRLGFEITRKTTKGDFFIRIESDFDFSYSISGNSFWKIVEGLRIGLEYIYGERFNIDGSKGNASRLWALFYYDF